MPDEDRNNGLFGNTFDNNSCGCNNCGCGCGGGDNTILIFLIIFLLLFTNFGARG